MDHALRSHEGEDCTIAPFFFPRAELRAIWTTALPAVLGFFERPFSPVVSARRLPFVAAGLALLERVRRVEELVVAVARVRAIGVGDSG